MNGYTVIGSYTISDIRKMVAFEAEVGDGEYSPKTEVIKFLLNKIDAMTKALEQYAASESWMIAETEPTRPTDDAWMGESRGWDIARSVLVKG